jgi:putative membrane protein insertion efficiency factor
MLTNFLLAMIRGYRATLGWFMGGQCRFEPTCSQYGLDAIRIHGPFYGSWLTFKRIARCQPFSRGGFDPVPPLDGGAHTDVDPAAGAKARRT